MAITNYKPLPRLQGEILSEFLSKIDKRDPNACWPWMGSVDSKGYGIFWSSNKAYLSHRQSHFIHTGIDPISKVVCHKCDTPLCNNWNHLVAASQRDNQLDKIRKNRQAKGASHGSRTCPERTPRGDRHASRTTSGWAQGEKNGRHVITASDAAVIRQLFVKGGKGEGSAKTLSLRFGLSISQIHNIASGSQWKY